MEKSSINSKKQSAFSLIEMLTLMAVIGVITAIGVPMITILNSKAEDVKTRRNAQTIASIFAAAQGAGLDFFIPGDEEATIQAVVIGGIVSQEGPFKDIYFGVPNISAAEQALAATFLEMNDAGSLLVYSGR